LYRRSLYLRRSAQIIFAVSCRVESYAHLKYRVAESFRASPISGARGSMIYFITGSLRLSIAPQGLATDIYRHYFVYAELRDMR
jgi:hypothetical protein